MFFTARASKEKNCERLELRPTGELKTLTPRRLDHCHLGARGGRALSIFSANWRLRLIGLVL